MNAKRSLPSSPAREAACPRRRGAGRARHMACAAAALLVLGGCATQDDRPAPPPVPDSPLIRAGASQVDPATTRRADTPAAPAPRDLGPLRVRATVGGREVDPDPKPSPESASVRSGAPAGDDDRVELNFVDADLPAVVRALARFTGRNFVVDPRVKGQLTLVSERPVDSRTAYDMLLGALRMQGVSVIEVGGISRVVPEADAKLQGVPVTAGRQAGQDSGLVTRVFRLQYENAATLVPVLRPMISPNNPINAYPNNNTLVVTDYADNMERIAKVIAGIDTPESLSADVIPVRYGVASDLATLVGQLMDTQGGNDPTLRVNVIADPRSNSVLVRAGNPARARLARDLVARLDNPQSQAGNLHVVYLRNAQAVKLAEVLRGALTGQSNTQGGTAGQAAGGLGRGSGSPWSGGGQAGGASGLLDAARSAQSGNGGLNGGLGTGTGMSGRLGQGNDSGAYAQDTQGTAFSAGGATVQADPTTNTLIISAPEPLYRSLREVIDQLDQRRAQVLVESLIVEVSSEDAAEFGVQWMLGADRLDSGGTNFIGGTNLGGSGLNLSPATGTSLDALGSGLSLGVINGTVDALGNQIINLGFLARAMQKLQGTNILSTPNLLTLDNEEASIIVGQTVPFVTGSYVTNSGDGSSNPFQTIEREDVGLTLRIRPQISEGGTVKLDLYQEVSSIDNTAVSNAGIITRKRALETSVLVDDGQIIVLGGLLEDSSDNGTQSVPVLGDIPILGALFRYDKRNRTKTNLMIFLRPHIVRNSQDSRRVSMDRYDYMRRVQDNARPEQRWPLPKADTPRLPALEPSGQPAGQELDLRPGHADRTLRQPPPATASSVEVHPAPARPEPAAAPAGGPPAIASEAARADRDGPAAVLEIARTDSAAEAGRIVDQVRATGLMAYTQVAPGGAGTLVRTRVARDRESIAAAIALLRNLGFKPEPVQP